MQPDSHPVGMQVGVLENVIEVAAAEAGDNAPVGGPLPQLVEGRGCSPFLLGWFAGQRNELEARLIGDTPRAARAGGLQQTILALQRCLAPPLGNSLLGNLQGEGDVLSRYTLMCQQRDPCPQRVTLGARLLPDQGLKLFLLLPGEANVVRWASAAHSQW